MFDDTFKITLVLFFVVDFNLLSCELDSFTFNYCIESFHIDIILDKTKFLYNTFTILLQFLVKNPKQFL